MSLTEPLLAEEEILKIKISDFQQYLQSSKEFSNCLLSTDDMFSQQEIEKMLQLEREHREWLRSEIAEGRQRLLNKKDRFCQLKENRQEGLDKSD